MLQLLLTHLPRQAARRATLALTCLLSFLPGSSSPAEPAAVPASLPALQDTLSFGGEERGGPGVLAPSSPAWLTRQKCLAALGVDRWHTAGYRGRGIKVAVLDTGFRGYHTHLGKDLPAHVTVRSFRDDGDLEGKDSEHGILCGEVIHALAPEAELLFANWDWGCPEQFLAAVRWARDQGAKVVSCSVVMPSWSDGEGGGAIHQELARILGTGSNPGDVLCFASAGNTTDRHWGGFFHEGGDGFHQWLPGVKDNNLRPWGEEPIAVELYAQPGTDYALYVYDTVTGKEVGHARTWSHIGDRSSAALRFPPQPDHSYRMRVRLLHGPAGVFHLTTTFGSISYTIPRANVCFPADGANVVGMGAVDEDGHRQSYSACGPNSSRPKPDLVATVPFPSMWRERPFGGTSAAAPQGSALAALWCCRHPDWTADHIRTTMRTSAHDLGPVGPDSETGYGLIQLPQQ